MQILLEILDTMLGIISSAEKLLGELLGGWDNPQSLLKEYKVQGYLLTIQTVGSEQPFMSRLTRRLQVMPAHVPESTYIANNNGSWMDNDPNF